MAAKETVYRARWVFPIDSSPIRDGSVRVSAGRIVDVAPTIPGQVDVDLGDVALLPKLVNAHTHLEFSDCKDVIGEPGVALSSWIGQVIAARGQVDHQQRNRNVQIGLEESAAAGVGLIGDIATTPTDYLTDNLGHCQQNVGSVNVVSFAEVLGLSKERANERLASAMNHAHSTQDAAVTFAISPHAPYSTPLSLVESVVQLARRNNTAVAMHLAESPDERILLSNGQGPFADSLRAAGLWQEGLFPYESSQRQVENANPVLELIHRLAEAPRGLLVHGNDLREDEIHAIAKHDQLSVVYCPRTHDFFGYEPHPVDQLIKAGIRVALGTDSRASNPDLSLWREIQFLLNHRQDLSPESILRMGTAAGADALLGTGSLPTDVKSNRQLGSSGQFGRIVAQPGGDFGGADSLISVKTAGKTLAEVYRDFSEHHCQCIRLPERA